MTNPLAQPFRIKVSATAEGLPAIRVSIAAGINATLVCSVARYREVVDAYLAGPSHRPAQQRLKAAIERRPGRAGRDMRHTVSCTGPCRASGHWAGGGRTVGGVRRQIHGGA